MVYNHANATASGNVSSHVDFMSRPRGSVTSAHTAGVDSRPQSSQARSRTPRSLPPWISSYDRKLGRPPTEEIRLLMRSASPQPSSSRTHQPQPLYDPPQLAPRPSVTREVGGGHSSDLASDDEVYDEKTGGKVAKKKKKKRRKPWSKKLLEQGRKWDHLRSAEPVIIVGGGASQQQQQQQRQQQRPPLSRWTDFMRATRYGRPNNETFTIVPSSYLDELQPQFNQPFRKPDPPRKQKRQLTAAKLWQLLVRHPLVPLVSRFIVLVTSIIALGLAVQIIALLRQTPSSPRSEMTPLIFAVIIDGLAIPYIGWMTRDEYAGQPFGLRSSAQKASLVLMDLFFIVFKAATAALAFGALFYQDSPNQHILRFARALASFMFVGLVSWTLSFTVNVFRLVYKLDSSDDDAANQWLTKPETGIGYP